MKKITSGIIEGEVYGVCMLICHEFAQIAVIMPHTNQQSAMQMNGCRHLVPLYPYHTTNYSY